MNQLEVTKIGKPAAWLINAASSIGLDYSGLTHEVTDHFRNHVRKRHGNPAKHGTATIKDTDFDRIPAIVESPDMVIIGAIRSGNLCNIYVKIENSMTWLYFDEVLDSKRNKALRSVTLYRITKVLALAEVLNNVSHNDKTDISKAKIISRP
jgi:hypothetical protein